MTIDLSQKIAKPFHKVHKSIRQEKYDEFWLKGGRGSTKSSFVPISIFGHSVILNSFSLSYHQSKFIRLSICDKSNTNSLPINLNCKIY